MTRDERRRLLNKERRTLLAKGLPTPPVVHDFIALNAMEEQLQKNRRQLEALD
jgi:hypothetical protein